MEITLIEKKNQKPKTMFKINKKEWNDPKIKEIFGSIKPDKESKLYKYFVLNGDYLNRNKNVKK